MNHIYKIIWCSSLQIFKVCSENAKSSKTKSSRTKNATTKIKSKITTFPQLTALALLLSWTNYAVADVTTTRITVNGVENPMTNPKVITDVAIINNGSSASANAQNGGVLQINDGNISTSGAQAHGLHSQDLGSSIEATGLVIDINSLADQTFGAHATDNGSITLNGGSITTDGERGYGILAQNGGEITSSTDITVNGAKAHAVQAGGLGTNSAYEGKSAGTVNLTGGKLIVNANNGNSWAAALHAVDSGKIKASNINIESQSYAALSESSSNIEIHDSIIKTTGNTAALVANNDRRKDNHDINAQGGELTVHNTTITTTGSKAYGAVVSDGGNIEITGGSITTTGDKASALFISNSGTITVNQTDLSSADAPTVAIIFDKKNQIANLTFGESTTAITNNGTLLSVSSLNNDGNDGIVNFTLDNGSKSTGDIIDARSGGGTNVTLEEKAIAKY